VGKVFAATSTVSGAAAGSGSGSAGSQSYLIGSNPTSPSNLDLILPAGSNDQTVAQAASGQSPSTTSNNGVNGMSTISTSCSGGGLGTYIGLVSGGLVEFITADTVSGFIQKWTGLGEGLTQINDLLIRHYMRAILWGLIATAAMVAIGPILHFVLYLNTTVLTTPAIHDIYTVLLSLVNIGFVIAIIIIAFATMFRNGKFGGSKNLIKVAAAALLINFGFFFASIVINAGDRVTYVFADAVSGTPYITNSTGIPANFGTEASLVGRYNVASVTCSVSSLLSSFSQGTSGFSGAVEKAIVFLAQPLVSITFGAVISLIWAAALLAITIVFLVRYAFLIFLLAILPISWLGLIFPSLKISIPGVKGSDPFSGWWAQFINWVIMGPMLLFLLYISHLLSDALTGSTNSFSQSSALVASSQLVIQLIAILIVNLIGLYGAVKMSGVAGAIAITAAGGAIGWAAQGLTNFSGSAAARFRLRSEAWQKSAQENKNKVGAAAQFAGARFLGTASRGFSGVALPPQYRTALEKAGLKVPQTKEFDVSKAVEGRKKQLEARMPNEVLAMARAKVNARNIPLARNAVDSAAILSYLIDKRQLQELNSDQLIPLLKSASSIGAQKDVLSVRPDLAAMIDNKKSGFDPAATPADKNKIVGEYMKSIGKAVDKVKPGQAENVLVQSLSRPKDLTLNSDLQANEAVILSLSNSQVSRILREGSSEQQKALVEGIKALNDKRGNALVEKLGDTDAAKEIDRQRKRLAEYVGGAGGEEEEEGPQAQQPESGPTILGPDGKPLRKEQSRKGGGRRGRSGGNPDFRALWNSIESPDIK
ncbi:MAG: hypothetical protein KGJ01_02980, partial [Patescibacteria group bacterium]|nr:hypothetical protein [Patescibacteria group bacterium]